MLTFAYLFVSIPLGEIKGLGPLGGEVTSLAATNCTPIIRAAEIISKSIGFVTLLSFVWFVFQVTAASLQWIGSSGEKQNVTIAREKLIHAIIGLAITVSAIFIVHLISAIIGVQSLFDFTGLVPKITPNNIKC